MLWSCKNLFASVIPFLGIHTREIKADPYENLHMNIHNNQKVETIPVYNNGWIIHVIKCIQP